MASPENRYVMRQFKLNIHRNQTCISLYVNFDSNNHYNYNYEEFRKKMKKLTLRYEIGIVTWQGGSLSHKTTGEIDFKDTSYFHSIRLGRLINRAELNRMSRDNDNELKIVANLFFIEKQSELTHITSFDMEKNKEIALSNQFEAMFNDDKYSDFTIITSDNEKIHVHRNILSARSVVFDTMLQTTMKENEFNEALINDIDGKSLVEFLRFIYSGKVQSFEGIAADLLYAAHKYEIEDLKPLCVQHLCSNLNLTNVLDTLLISNLHSEEKFKRFCFAFMKIHYKAIKDDEMWKEIPTKLCKEFLDFTILECDDKKDEHTISSTIELPKVSAVASTVPAPAAAANVNNLAQDLNRARIN